LIARLDGDDDDAHADRNATAAFVSCSDPTTSKVGIPREAAKTASCGPRARARGSEEREITASEKALPLLPLTLPAGFGLGPPRYWMALRRCHASTIGVL
jgi:hypothetical protein